MAYEEFTQDATIVLTLLLLEAVLSFDNAAILAAMVRRLPVADRRKALLYGLGGAYILRFSAIALASFLIATPMLKIVGGLYLVYLSARHFIRLLQHRKDGHREIKVKPGLLARWGVPALVAIIIQIELVDLAFAVDQVVVAVAFTDKIWLIVIASFLGILFLRLAAAVIARIMDWLPTLEHMAYVAVGYVGVKLIFLHPYFSPGGTCLVPALTHESAAGPVCEIPTMISAGITLALFGIPVLVKLIFGVPRSAMPEEGEMPRSSEKDIEAAQPGPALPERMQPAQRDLPKRARDKGK